MKFYLLSVAYMNAIINICLAVAQPTPDERQDNMNSFINLNSEQQRAVLHDKGPLLILAGAGSGKTRVLTNRMAYLMEEKGVNPIHLLAITFTNKAAREMRERVDSLVGYGSEYITVSTFHSLCVRILRRFIDRIGYSQSFTIYDTDDQKTLMHEVCKYLEIDTKNVKERTLLHAISSAKDELISPEEYDTRARGDYNKQRYANVYREYQKRLKTNNALDFDDIICKTVELFTSDLSVLEYYQNRYKYIMVDEYQDTNTAQFRLISLLASTRNEAGETEHNLCVVGDDDQSIYKFRGANIRNILEFEDQYPDTKVIRLEQNYRSTKTILDAANQVIRNNFGRKDKTLWTDNEKGDPIIFMQYEHDYEEAAAIVNEIEKEVMEGNYAYQDFALLYRTNAQSRILEEKCVQRGLPYKLVGGVNFYQRREVKDIIAYLKTIDNASDGIAVKRIINVPKRGIGLSTIDKLQEFADLRDMTFYDSLCSADSMISINGGTKTKLNQFAALITGLRQHLYLPDASLKGVIDELLEATKYLEYLSTQSESEDEYNDRVANINELISKAASFQEETEESSAEPATLSRFLEEISLVADIDSMEDGVNTVTLMTLHSAKGLEFPCVYLCGMEEGIFPSYMSINAEDPVSEIEEERRLCYVGITRAKKKLSITCARQRMLRGETQFNRPSRFIEEIPRFLLSKKEPTQKKRLADEDHKSFSFRDLYQDAPRSLNPISFEKPKPVLPPVKQFSSSTLGCLSYEVGDKVKHLKFGTGTVTAITKGGRDYEVTVEFPVQGVRKMLASFANLTKLD